MSHHYDVLQAIEQGNTTRLKELLQEQPELANARDEQGVSMVLRAMYRHNGDALDTLMGLAPTIDVFTAAALGDVRRLRLLLDADAAAAESFQGDGFTPLQLACFFASKDTAVLLLERGADPEAVSRNGMELRAIHSAAASRSVEIMELLLARGVNVHAALPGGWTALHAAGNNGDHAMARVLLTGGANPVQENDFEQTPLGLAREKGDEALQRLLQG
jgi:ankyrin repeat protein